MGVAMRRLTASLASLSVALGIGAMTGCTDTTDSAGRTASATPTTSVGVTSASPLPLSVLVFNVEYGGTPATDAVMADVDADVVGVLESYDRLPEIAAAAGYP